MAVSTAKPDDAVDSEAAQPLPGMQVDVTKPLQSQRRLAVPQVSRQVSCSAEHSRLVKKIGSAVGATALALALGLSQVDAAKADIAGLTPCSQSKAYAKRQKNELKSLQKRLKQVPKASIPDMFYAISVPCVSKQFMRLSSHGQPGGDRR